MSRRAKPIEQVSDSVVTLPTPPDGWAWSNVGAIAQQDEQPVLTGPFGSTLGRGDFVHDGIPLLTIGCLKESGITLDKAFYISAAKARQLDRYRVREGDVLFSRSASVGRAGLVRQALDGSIINYHLMRLRLDARVIDPRLFIYFVRGSQIVRAYLREVNHGATRDGINTNDLLRMPVALPPLPAQRRIVERIDELFSDLDAGVAALERIRANLKRYRASVLKAAVEGRLTESWRAKNPLKETGEQLLTRILKERRRKWEEDQLAAFAAAGKQPPKNWRARYQEPASPNTSSLPTIPSGWCWATVQQVGSVQLGRQRSPRHHNGPHMRPYLRVANVFEDRIDISDVMEMNFTPNEFEVFRLAAGDILLNEGQSMELVGRPAMYQDEVPGACFTNTLVRFRASNGLEPQYALRVFLAYLKNRRFQKIATITVNIAHLGAGRFSEIEFPLPPADEQAVIVAEVDRHFSIIDEAERRVVTGLARAVRLRQSILKQAFAGKLVAQDPADEPAAVLLARIQQSQAATAVLRTKGKQPSDEFLRRAAIVSYTVKRLAPRPSFGRTQLEKTLHLAQSHLGIELGLQFERYAAGPFDKSIYRLEATAKKSGWFTKQDRRRYGVTYHPGPKIEAMCQHAARLLGDKQAAFDRLLDQIAAMNTDEAELFATAYAAWNDLLIDGRPADDAVIIAEVHGWHESKKRFTPTVIRERLQWMRQHQYVPFGKGQRTRPMRKSSDKLARPRGSHRN